MTVDMVATGTDIKPIEIVMFMRAVKSRVLFEQMKGRGVRVIDPNDLRAVSGGRRAKTHFVIVDCVGMTETQLADTQPLDRKRTVVSRRCWSTWRWAAPTPTCCRRSRAGSRASTGSAARRSTRAWSRRRAGRRWHASAARSWTALDPDRQIAEARRAFAVPENEEPTEPQVKQAAEALLKRATEPLATKPALRTLLQDLKREVEQVIDEVSEDELLEAGASEEAKEKAKALVADFERFIEENKDEIDALQFFYASRTRSGSVPGHQGAGRGDQGPAAAWTPERLWRAYETLDKDKVRGASGERLLTDIVSLVRFALHKDEELVPFGDQVRERFETWMAQQENQGRAFTAEQRRWLEMMRDHIATSLEMTVDDLDYTPFAEEGGLGKAPQVFGDGARKVLA